MDPICAEMLAKCSLTVPTLPKTVHYYNYDGEIRSSVSITGVTPEFYYDYDDGTISITVKISGKKTYDANGDYYSNDCYVGWKLYEPGGNVVRDGTFYTPSLSVGETFTNQAVDVLYSWDDYVPGAYTLELFDYE